MQHAERTAAPQRCQAPGPIVAHNNMCLATPTTPLQEQMSRPPCWVDTIMACESRPCIAMEANLISPCVIGTPMLGGPKQSSIVGSPLWDSNAAAGNKRDAPLGTPSGSPLTSSTEYMPKTLVWCGTMYRRRRDMRKFLEFRCPSWEIGVAREQGLAIQLSWAPETVWLLWWRRKEHPNATPRDHVCCGTDQVGV